MATIKTSVVITDDAGKVTNFDYPAQNITLSEPPVNQPAPVEPAPVEPAPVEPLPTGMNTIPLSRSAFIGNVSSRSVTLQRGQNLSKKTITDTGHTASVICLGDNTLEAICIESREGVRIAGSGLFEIRNSFVSVNGTESDHADGLQTYSPGSRGVIKVRNSTFKCGLTAATAGFFIADNWTGTIDLEGVVFWGGPFGLRVHPDVGGNNILRLKDVFFVGPFGYAATNFGNVQGHRNVFEIWENVRQATIVNGKLVPGNLMPKPF